MSDFHRTQYNKFSLGANSYVPISIPERLTTAPRNTAPNRVSAQSNQSGLNEIIKKKIARKEQGKDPSKGFHRKNEPVRVYLGDDYKQFKEKKKQSFKIETKESHPERQYLRTRMEQKPWAKQEEPKPGKRYANATDGFTKWKFSQERPQSKQQQRNSQSTALKEEQAELKFDILSIQSDKNSECDFDEFAFQKKEQPELDYSYIDSRPKTSKGRRGLQQRESDNQRQPSRKRTPVKHQICLVNNQPIEEIAIKTMFEGQYQRQRFQEIAKEVGQDKKRKNVFTKQEGTRIPHPLSAKPMHRRNEVVIKYNNGGTKVGQNVIVPFQTSIGKEFLKLFANEEK